MPCAYVDVTVKKEQKSVEEPRNNCEKFGLSTMHQLCQLYPIVSYNLDDFILTFFEVIIVNTV